MNSILSKYSLHAAAAVVAILAGICAPDASASLINTQVNIQLTSGTSDDTKSELWVTSDPIELAANGVTATVTPTSGESFSLLVLNNNNFSTDWLLELGPLSWGNVSGTIVSLSASNANGILIPFNYTSNSVTMGQSSLGASSTYSGNITLFVNHEDVPDVPDGGSILGVFGLAIWGMARFRRRIPV